MTWSGSPTLDRSPQRIHPKHRSSVNHSDDTFSDNGVHDEFDDFEEGAEAGEGDEFGDFDDALDGSSAAGEVSEPSPLSQDAPQPSFVSRQCFNNSQPILLAGIVPRLLILILC